MTTSCLNRPRRIGFTLVELLVVIGIIAVLVGILLPALNKARESARQVNCLSNMKQIATATLMFANEHKGWMPGNGSSVTRIDPSSGAVVSGTAANDFKSPADWIAWSRKTDALTGASYSGGMDQNITMSALTPYLGAKYVDHTINGANPNTVNSKLEAVYRCPSDNVESRSKFADGNNGGKGLYRYSYAMNFLVTNPVKGIGTGSDGVAYDKTARNGWSFTGKISSIKRSSDVILLICEDDQCLDDGYFNPNPTQWGSGQCEMLASRHSTMKRVAANNYTNTAAGNRDVMGNVAFVDGHGAMVGRKEALSRKYSSRPDPDPSGF